MGVTVKGSVVASVRALKTKVQPTIADALYVGERQRARILDRTARGVDVNGAAFASYSTRRYYWSPNDRLNGRTKAKVTDQQRAAAVKRFARSIKARKKAGNAPYVTPSGLSICFPLGYAQFKKWLGRSTVDLRGKNAPHMLQAIQIQAKDGGGGAAKEVRIGIYGPKAKLANAHNSGGGKLPKRRFFGASRADRAAAVKDLKTVIGARLK